MAIREKDVSINVVEVTTSKLSFNVLGTTPLIMNRMSEKTWRELLMPKPKKNAAEKASSMKHNPIQEFKDSPYKIIDESAPTFLAVMVTAFKRAMMTAALDMPGSVNKSKIGRLVYVHGNLQPVYGVPKIFSTITRSADMNKTPDVRTRAILPEWACQIKIEFTTPILNDQSIVNLLAAAGFQSGIGDWRQEKGSGNFGSFKIVGDDDKDFKRIVKEQGRKAQIAAMESPEAFDLETEELISWFDVEVKRRGFKVAA
jgi:hypothetical protein